MANGRKVLMSCNLQSVLNQLYEVGIDYFVRIHYSHAVNLYHIKSRSGNVLFVGRKDLAVSDKKGLFEVLLCDTQKTINMPNYKPNMAN